jgi:cytochrome c-type biogenesis protein CcmE
MSVKTLQLVVLLAVFAVIVVGIVRRPASEPILLSVDQIVREQARWQGENVSVQGIVQPASRQQGADGDWRFNVVSAGQTLSVHYTGAVPSTLVDAAEVIVVGQLRDGEFRARTVLVNAPG